MNFESCKADYVNSKYLIAINTATRCLHIALWALGLSYGITVWIRLINFVTSCDYPLHCSTNIDFVDLFNLYLVH